MQRPTSLEHIGGTTLDLEVFDIKRSEVMVTWKRADEWSKEITQTHEGKHINEMRHPQPEMNADKCHVQERHTANMTTILVPFSPTISGEYPNYF